MVYYHVPAGLDSTAGVGKMDVNGGNKTNCETCAHVRK